MLLVPQVVAYYYARETLRQVARMYYQYGYSKPLVVGKLGRVTTFRQLVPPLFLLSLLVSAILAPRIHSARVVLAGMAATYILTAVGCALVAARKSGLRTMATLALVFPIVHFSYGIGYLRSVIEFLRGSRRTWPASLPLSR